MSFEPKTKAGQFLYDSFKKVDDFIKEKTDEPGEKEVVEIVIGRLESIIKASPTKIDDILGVALITYFKKRYDI